jgi:putative flippase GtrA
MTEGARFLRFLAAGGASAAANAVARWLLSRVVSYELAVALAYLVGMAVAFLLMRRFVFQSGGAGNARHQAARFALVNAWSLAQVWAISVGLARVVFPAVGFDWHAETVAHLIGLGSLAVTSYVAHKRFSFRDPGAQPPEGRQGGKGGFMRPSEP